MCSTVDLASCMAAEYNITPDRVDICLISNLTSNYSLGTLQGFCDSPLPNCNFPEVLLGKKKGGVAELHLRRGYKTV